MPRTVLLASALLTACGPSPAGPGTSSSSTTGDTTTSSSTTRPSSSTIASVATTTVEPTTTASFDPTTTADTTDTQEFISTPDSGTGLFECDLFTQDCPTGKKCAPWAEGGGTSWNATKCVDITGAGAPGEPCTAPGGGIDGVDDCALGVFCWDVDETHHGTCLALCTGTPDAPTCPAHSSCAIGASVLAICIPDCDPLLQDCAGDDLCIPNGDSFLCVLDASGDEGQTNDPCEFANSCDKGLVCLDTASASAACEQASQGCCQPFCNFPDTPCPNPDQQCMQWFDPMIPIPEGYENVGVCAIPD